MASVITDRICINTKGASNDWISSWEIASCCVEDKCGTGCFGGYASKAFEFYVKHGVVTGGEFGSNEVSKCSTINMSLNRFIRCYRFTKHGERLQINIR